MELFWLWAERVGMVVMPVIGGILWYHVIKCDGRSSKVWKRFDALFEQSAEQATDIGTIKGYLEALKEKK